MQLKKGILELLFLVKKEALSVKYGIGIEEHDQEGRVITVEYEDFYLVNCYTPNAQAELKRIEYRLKWEEDFLMFLKELEKTKPVILCGDLNVAHNNIDLKNWKTNRKNPGFSDQERAAFTNFLANGFVDSFRHFYPDLEGAYSWWSYRFNARQNNSLRIDYFCVSEALVPKMEDSFILSDVFGSDHCPVGLTLTVK